MHLYGNNILSGLTYLLETKRWDERKRVWHFYSSSSSSPSFSLHSSLRKVRHEHFKNMDFSFLSVISLQCPNIKGKVKFVCFPTLKQMYYVIIKIVSFSRELLLLISLLFFLSLHHIMKNVIPNTHATPDMKSKALISILLYSLSFPWNDSENFAQRKMIIQYT